MTTKPQRVLNDQGQFAAVSPEIEHVASEVVDAVVQVHKALGPGLLESICQTCLCHELASRQIAFKKELVLPVQYKNLRLESGLR